MKMRQAERQRKAVEAIREAGGVVWYRERDYHSVPRPSTPAWLRRLAGEEIFSDVIAISDFNTEVGDVVLEHINELRRLDRVELATEVTDSGFEKLKHVTHLRHLQLAGCGVTDIGVENVIKELPELVTLQLSSTHVTDAGLEHIGGLTDLGWLYLANTRITDAGLEHLKGLTELRFLDLFGTHVTQEGIEELQEALPECNICWSPYAERAGCPGPANLE